MKEKNGRVKLLTILLILAIIAIIVMGIFMYKIYNEKIEETEKSTQLQEQIDSLNKTSNSLQEKIDSISKITSGEKSTNNQDKEGSVSSKINVLDGRYENDEELEAYIYEFSGNNVSAGALGTSYGTYKINDNKVKITYTKAEDPEGNEIDEFPDGQTVELTILNENTLVDDNGTKYIKK